MDLNSELVEDVDPACWESRSISEMNFSCGWSTGSRLSASTFVDASVHRDVRGSRPLLRLLLTPVRKNNQEVLHPTGEARAFMNSKTRGIANLKQTSAN